MRRNRRASFPGTGCRRSVARARTRGPAFCFGKRCRCARSEEHPEIPFEKLPTIGLPSPFSPAILGFVRRFNESLRRCRTIYQRFNPQVVLGMGGFTSTAPVLAGKMRGVPTFIHESNAIPGKANKMTARLVRAVLLGF